jgi:hypothetical protein
MKQINRTKGVNLDPKTDAEALALLRWMFGPQVPAFTPKR